MILPYLFCVENHVCLSRGVQVTGATWRAAIMIVVGVRDLVQRTGDGQAHVRYSVAGRSRGQVTLCVIYTVHKETRSTSFLVWAQNQGRRFLPVWPQNGGFGFSGLDLKIDSYGLVIWATKLPQQFLDLGLKIKRAMVCRLCHKTEGG
jgi:hypothetical protein